MGENSKKTAKHDRRLRASAWLEYSADWIRNGNRAAQMLRFIKNNRLGEVNMCLAGTFDGGIYLPMALCAEMYRTCDGEYKDMLSRVARRPSITTD